MKALLGMTNSMAKRHDNHRQRARPDWLPPLAGLLAAALGLLNIGSALTPNLTSRARLLLHLGARDLVPIAHALALPAGVALLVLAHGLARRRRHALGVAVGVLVIAGILNLVKGLDFEEATLNWALAVLLVWGRSAFYVRHDRDTLRTSLWLIPTLVVLAYAVTLVAVKAGTGAEFTLSRGAQEAFDLLLMTSGPLHFHHHFHWVPTAVEILSASTLVAAAWLLFRPLAAPLRPGSGQRIALDLVRRYGADTLSFFKLRDDKQRLFSADGRAFVGYKVENGVMLVSGDPVGPDDALGDIPHQVRAFAEVRGLKVAVLGASEGTRDLWEQNGLRSFYIGDEALVDVGEFSLEGRAIRKVRQSVTRLSKAGYSAAVHAVGELSASELCELERISERWLGGVPERGFSMAMDSLRGEHLEDSLVVVARDGDGAARGFLHFVPVYARPAASLSFMRRDRDTPNGLTEFMVVRAIELLHERGIKELSLNFAAFARLMHSPSGPFERLLGRLATLFNPYFQIESLYSFNAKFFPRWEPRYLLYEGPFGLPRAGLAAMWAEGQLPKPRIGSGGGQPSRSTG